MDENEPLTVTVALLEAEFDADAVRVLREAEANTAILHCSEVDAETELSMPEAQRAAAEQVLESGGMLLDLSLTDEAGDPLLFSDGAVGSVLVRIPFAAEAGTTVRVCYIAPDGTKTDMDAEYDAENGIVQFRTSHFSLYAVEASLPQTGNNAVTRRILTIAALLLIGCGTAAVMCSGIRRRKEDGARV